MEYLVITFIGCLLLILIYSLTFRQLEKAEIIAPMFFVIG